MLAPQRPRSKDHGRGLSPDARGHDSAWLGVAAPAGARQQIPADMDRVAACVRLSPVLSTLSGRDWQGLLPPSASRRRIIPPSSTRLRLMRAGGAARITTPRPTCLSTTA